MSEIEKIDVNTADLETLAALPGIGEALAERIIQYRETVHPFEEVIELAAVPGISERMVRAFADQVVITTISEDNQPPMIDDETAIPPAADATPTEPPLPPELAALLEPLEPSPAAPMETAVEEQDTPMPENETGQLPLAAEAADEADLTQKLSHPAAPDSSADETADLPDVADLMTVGAAVPEPEPAVEAELPPPPPRSRRAETPAPAAPPAISQRRGCVFVILSAILGALLGSALTLALLSAINGGNLNYASSRSTQVDLRDVRSSVAANAATQEAADTRLGSQVATLSPRLDVAATQQAALAQTVTAVQSDLGESAATIATLQTTTAALDERVTSLAEAAANFDLFLNGLRDLLFALQGPPQTAVPITNTVTTTVTTTTTPTTTPTASGETPAAIGTATATATTGVTVSTTPTPTLIPTRTPRPTATPIVRPTNAPTPQPEP